MRNLKFFAISSLLISITLPTSAQLKLNDYGNVKIASTNSDFAPRLSVGDTCHFANNNSNSFSWGIAAGPLVQENKINVAIEGYVKANQSYSSETNVGVLGFTKLNPNHGRNFGVVGSLDYGYGPDCVGAAGVYATCYGYYLYYPANIQGIYAAYFSGPTNISGRATIQEIYTPADERLNDNVESIGMRKDGSSVLDDIQKMNVLEFNMKSREKAVESKGDNMVSDGAKNSYQQLKKEEEELYSRRHFGLSAKELEKVYPNLVLKGQDGYQYINYTELVPILIRSIQELKAELDEVKSKDTEVKRARAASFEEDEDIDLKDATSIPAMATLAQNTPNPFSERTTIRFTLPENAQKAFIYIFDMSGKMQKQIPVDSSMESVIIEGYELRAGMYIYSLVIGGKEIDTKRMILSK